MSKARVSPRGTRTPKVARVATSGAGRHALRRPARAPWRSRLAGVGLTLGVAALAVAVTGFTYGQLSSSSNASMNAAAGTVTLSTGTSSACNATNVAPGKPISNCTLSMTYNGDSDAYFGLDVFVAAKAGSGGTALYNPSDALHALSVSISDGSTTYTIPTTATTCPSSGTYTLAHGYTCYQLDNELVSTNAFSTGATRTFTTSASLPTGTAAAENPYQGGSASVVLTAHATSAANQTVVPCVAGGTCNQIQWS